MFCINNHYLLAYVIPLINLINPIPKRYLPTNGLPSPSNALPFLLQLL